MHYLDKEQLNSNFLEIVVYCHKCDTKKCGFVLDIASIQSCQFFQPRLLRKIFKRPNQLFNSAMMELEQYYRLKIVQYGWDNYIVTEIREVTDSTDKFHTLH